MKQLAATTALLVAAAATLTCTPKDPKYSFRYAEKRARLENGLRLVVIPDKTSSLVEVHVRYEVGSNEDPRGKAGLAHLVEHMMFQHRMLGPDKPATFDLLPQIVLGFNAWTSFDLTHYYLIGPKEDLESLLRIEAYRMNARCQSIPPGQFDREREVVRNEIRGGKGTAEGLIPEILSQEVYPKGHPYSHTTGGDDRQLASIQFQDVCDFLEKYYTPDRAVVIVTGNVDPDDVGKRVSYLFGGIPRRKPAPRVAVSPIQLKYKKVVHELDIERPLVAVLWRVPAVNTQEFTNVEALFFFIGKLAKLADDWEFASAVQPILWGGKLAPTFCLLVELFPGGDPDKALEYVWRATSTAHWGVRHIDFDRETKNRLKMDWVEGIESLARRAGAVADAIQFPSGEVDFNASGQEYLINEFKKIEKLTSSRYRDFVKETLEKDEAVVVVFQPKKTATKGDVRAKLEYSGRGHDKQPEPLVDPAEAKRPLPAPRSSSVLGTAERYTLGNGMRVILLAYKGLPIVHAELVLNAGAAFEPRNKAGLARVAARFLRPPRDSNYTNWVSFWGDADADHTQFETRGLNIHTDVVIEALERTVKIGEYDQPLMERWHKKVRDGYKSARYRRYVGFEKAVSAALYGADHPYTTNGEPVPESVENIGYDAAMAWKRQHYTAKNATLIVVGDFDKKQAKEKIAETFGAWDGGRQDTPISPARPARAAPEYVGVLGADEQQMQVTIAYPSPAGTDGQEAARMVLTEMLNEQMSVIRTELGATYGTRAARSGHVGPNAYEMGGRVDSARAGEALKAMRDKVEELRRGVDLERKFALARRQVLRRFIAESTDTQVIAARLARISVFGLGPEFFDQLVKSVAAVSPAQVKALIARELDPKLETVVCMADKKTVDRAYREANVGKVKYVEPR